MDRDFIIDQVSWHTQTENTESRVNVLARFRTVVRFLEENGLTERPLSNRVDESFALRSADLTEEGVAVMRKAMTRGWAALTAANHQTDVRPLENTLAKLRKSTRR